MANFHFHFHFVTDVICSVFFTRYQFDLYFWITVSFRDSHKIVCTTSTVHTRKVNEAFGNIFHDVFSNGMDNPIPDKRLPMARRLPWLRIMSSAQSWIFPILVERSFRICVSSRRIASKDIQIFTLQLMVIWFAYAASSQPNEFAMIDSKDWFIQSEVWRSSHQEQIVCN